MGDRYNIHMEQTEAERYRRKVPLTRRLVNKAMEIGFVVSIVALPVAAAWWFGRM